MTDRELLEAAAKAAKLGPTKWQDLSGWGEVRYGLSEALYSEKLLDYWNPLQSDSDAFRLAAGLHIEVTFPVNIMDGRPGPISACAVGYPGLRVSIQRNQDGSGDDGIMRRAITEAAAQLFKVM